MNGLLDISSFTGLPQQEPSRGLPGESPAGGELFAALLAGMMASAAGLAKPQAVAGSADTPSPTTSAVAGAGPAKPALADLPWPPTGMPGKAEAASAPQDDVASAAAGHGPAAPLAEGSPEVEEGGAANAPLGAENGAPMAEIAGMPADSPACVEGGLSPCQDQPAEPSTAAARTEPRQIDAGSDPRPMPQPDETASLEGMVEPVRDPSLAIDLSSHRQAMPRALREPSGTRSDPRQEFSSEQAVAGSASPERPSAIEPASRGELPPRALRAGEGSDPAAPAPAAPAPVDGVAASSPLVAGSLGMAPAAGSETGAVPGMAPAADGVMTPMHLLGQDAAGRSVTARLVSRADEDGQRLTIELDPADLGPVEVALHIDEQGRAAAVFSAERAETLQLLQRDAAGLAQMLNTAGLSLGQENLGFMLRDGAADMGRQQRPSGKPTAQARHRDAIGDPQAASGNPSFISGRGLLDLRV